MELEPKEFHWPFSLIYSSITRFMVFGYRELAERVGVPESAESLLDVGGGDCRMAIAFAERHPQLIRIVSVDISADMTRRAGDRVAQAGLSSVIKPECEDMHSLPYEDGSFDVVVSFATLHHSRDPVAMLHEAWRVLKPGGIIRIIDGYGRPSLARVIKEVQAEGGSALSGFVYWTGTKGCLSRDRIVEIVSRAGLPDVSANFDRLLAIIGGEKEAAPNHL